VEIDELLIEIESVIHFAVRLNNTPREFRSLIITGCIGLWQPDNGLTVIPISLSNETGCDQIPVPLVPLERQVFHSNGLADRVSTP
jgi:hypothetical protein